MSHSGSGLYNQTLSEFLNAKKRKAYFAFHYDDIMRVNNVRNAWKITHPDAPQNRSFYDSSLWESRKLTDPEAVKRLIREGVEYTSAVCVLIGTHTYHRKWVRYEIARAVIDGRGLVGVHLNDLPRIGTGQPDPLGPNPLDCMAVGTVQTLYGPEYYLFENNGSGWVRYQDYTRPVNLPTYLRDPSAGYVFQLSAGARSYNYVANNGHQNIGSWIDQAAQQVGR